MSIVASVEKGGMDENGNPLDGNKTKAKRKRKKKGGEGLTNESDGASESKDYEIAIVARDDSTVDNDTCVPDTVEEAASPPPPSASSQPINTIQTEGKATVSPSIGVKPILKESPPPPSSGPGSGSSGTTKSKKKSKSSPSPEDNKGDKKSVSFDISPASITPTSTTNPSPASGITLESNNANIDIKSKILNRRKQVSLLNKKEELKSHTHLSLKALAIFIMIVISIAVFAYFSVLAFLTHSQGIVTLNTDVVSSTSGGASECESEGSNVAGGAMDATPSTLAQAASAGPADATEESAPPQVMLPLNVKILSPNSGKFLVGNAIPLRVVIDGSLLEASHQRKVQVRLWLNGDMKLSTITEQAGTNKEVVLEGNLTELEAMSVHSLKVQASVVEEGDVVSYESEASFAVAKPSLTILSPAHGSQLRGKDPVIEFVTRDWDVPSDGMVMLVLDGVDYKIKMSSGTVNLEGLKPGLHNVSMYLITTEDLRFTGAQPVTILFDLLAAE